MRGKGYARALDALYTAAQDAAAWPEALTVAANYLGALGGILVCNPAGGGPGTIVSGRLDDDLNRLYATRHTDNLWTRAIRATAPAGPVIAGSLVDERDLVRSACYDEVIRPHGAIDMAILNAEPLSRDGDVGGFGFPLSRGQVGDADGVARRLGRLAPHLCRALSLSLRLAEAGTTELAFANTLERLTVGAMVLDRSGRVVSANSAGAQILSTSRDLRVDPDGRLCGAVAADTQRLLAEVRFALGVNGASATGAGVIRLRGLDGAGPTLMVSPLPRPALTLGSEFVTARALVLVLDRVGPSAGEAAAQAAFGLTMAEARVAGLVAQGADRPSAAAVLGVSVETIKKHLQRCYGKTGTHGQVELARLMLRLSTSGIRNKPHASGL